jgi:hypothetical protein
MCENLYYALKFKDGEIAPGIANLTQVAKMGILPYDPRDSTRVLLSREPITERALERVGDKKVLEHDFKLEKFAAQLRSARETGSEDFIKGKIQQQLFCWHLIKAQLQQPASVPLRLAAALEPILASSFPESFLLSVVEAQRALPDAQARVKFGGRSAFDVLCRTKGAADIIIYEVDATSGAGVAFTVFDSLLEPVLATVHCTVDVESRMGEVLRAASPAWQYVSKQQRKRIIDGVPVPPSDDEVMSNRERAILKWSSDRIDFVALWSANEKYFSSAGRIAFCLGNYQPDCMMQVNKMNAHNDHSPILLCKSDGHFGAVSALLKEYSPRYSLSSTGKWAFLHAQSAEKVRDSDIDTVEVADDEEAI